jgi:hypothetical protein
VSVTAAAAAFGLAVAAAWLPAASGVRAFVAAADAAGSTALALSRRGVDGGPPVEVDCRPPAEARRCRGVATVGDVSNAAPSVAPRPATAVAASSAAVTASVVPPPITTTGLRAGCTTATVDCSTCCGLALLGGAMGALLAATGLALAAGGLSTAAAPRARTAASAAGGEGARMGEGLWRAVKPSTLGSASGVLVTPRGLAATGGSAAVGASCTLLVTPSTAGRVRDCRETLVVAGRFANIGPCRSGETRPRPTTGRRAGGWPCFASVFLAMSMSCVASALSCVMGLGGRTVCVAAVTGSSFCARSAAHSLSITPATRGGVPCEIATRCSAVESRPLAFRTAGFGLYIENDLSC